MKWHQKASINPVCPISCSNRKRRGRTVHLGGNDHIGSFCPHAACPSDWSMSGSLMNTSWVNSVIRKNDDESPESIRRCHYTGWWSSIAQDAGKLVETIVVFAVAKNSKNNIMLYLCFHIGPNGKTAFNKIMVSSQFFLWNLPTMGGCVILQGHPLYTHIYC